MMFFFCALVLTFLVKLRFKKGISIAAVLIEKLLYYIVQEFYINTRAAMWLLFTAFFFNLQYINERPLYKTN